MAWVYKSIGDEVLKWDTVTDIFAVVLLEKEEFLVVV